MVSCVQLSRIFEEKLTSVRTVSRIPLSILHSENLRLKLCRWMAPSLVVQYFRVGQGFRHQNSVPLMKKQGIDMTLWFDPESFDDYYLQTSDQDWLQA
jgi:hypothetical protein